MTSNDFSIWLNTWMEEHHYTQTAVGELLDCSHVTVSKWQRGIHLPNRKQIRKLIDISGVDAMKMYQMCGYYPAGATPGYEGEGGKVNPRIRKIIAQLDGLDDEVLDLLFDQIRLVLKPHARKMLEASKKKAAE